MMLWKHTPPLRALVTAVAVSLGMPAPSDVAKAPGRPSGRDLGTYLEGFAGAGIQVERVKNG